MTEAGWRIAKQPVKPDLARRAAEEIGASDNMSDAHHPVVYHHGKLVGMDAIRTAEHEVCCLGGEVFVHRSPAQIVEVDRGRCAGHADAQ